MADLFVILWCLVGIWGGGALIWAPWGPGGLGSQGLDLELELLRPGLRKEPLGRMSQWSPGSGSWGQEGR